MMAAAFASAGLPAADPTIDPTLARNDNLYQASLTLTTPIVGSFAASLSFEYLKNDSNLPNFRFDDKGIFLAGTWAF